MNWFPSIKIISGADSPLPPYQGGLGGIPGNLPNPLEATLHSIRRDYPDAFGVRVLGTRNKSESEVAMIYTYNLPAEEDGLAMHFTGVSLYRRIPSGAGPGGSSP